MNNYKSSDGSVGYLTVMVSTARGAIPLEDAIVNVRGGDPQSSDIIYSMLSDRDGKTPKVILATPPLSYSEAPSDNTAYSVYNVDVFKEGYVPLFFHNVPIFPSVHSIQPAIMVPDSSALAYGAEENINTPKKNGED